MSRRRERGKASTSTAPPVPSPKPKITKRRGGKAETFIAQDANISTPIKTTTTTANQELTATVGSASVASTSSQQTSTNSPIVLPAPPLPQLPIANVIKSPATVTATAGSNMIAANAATGASSYRAEIAKMMYTFGDAKQPNMECVVLVEQFVKSLITEMLNEIYKVAHRRGSPRIALPDVLFLLRKEPEKLARVHRFLNWKLLRKRAKQGVDDVAVVEALATSTSTSTTSNETTQSRKRQASGLTTEKLRKLRKLDVIAELADFSDIDKYEQQRHQSQKTVAADTETGGDPKAAETDLDTSMEDLLSGNDVGAGAELGSDGLAALMSRAAQKSEAPSAVNLLESSTLAAATASIEKADQQRLKAADDVTRHMSTAEYLEYTKCREASFAYQTPKKFHDWLGLPSTMQLNEELTDVLGYLSWECVGLITQVALIVRRDMQNDANQHCLGIGVATSVLVEQYLSPLSLLPSPLSGYTSTRDASTLSAGDSEKLTANQIPLEPVHILEASRRLHALRASPVAFQISRDADSLISVYR